MNIAFIPLFFFQFFAIGASTTLIKIIVTNAPPLTSLGFRLLVGGVILKLFHWLCVRDKESVLQRRYAADVIVGFLFRICIPSTMAYWALQHVSAVKMSLLYTLSPFISCTLSYLVLGEKVTVRRMLGVCIGLSAVVPLLLWSELHSQHALGLWANVSLPVFVLFLVMTSLCFGAVHMKSLFKRNKHLSVFSVNATDALLSAPFILLMASFREVDSFHRVLLPSNIGWNALLLVFSFALVAPMYSLLLKRFSATLLSIASLSVPFFTAFTNWLYFGESIGIQFFAVIAITALACYVFGVGPKKRAVSKKFNQRAGLFDIFIPTKSSQV